MQSAEREFNMKASDEAREEIARQVADGMTSGRVDSSSGEKVAWELKFNGWKY